MIGLTDFHVARTAELLKYTAMDWDRRAHQFSVLAEAVADSRVPSTWLSREPRCVDALLLHAWASLVRGRRSGGMDDANAVVRSCYRVAESLPDDPTPWVIVLGVYRLERHERRSVMAVWREVVARDRWHREAHLQMLGYLSPEEGGTRAQVLDFVDSLRIHMPSNAPTVALELTAAVNQYQSILVRGGVEALLAQGFWKHAPVADALDKAAEMWPQTGFLRHAAALADLNLLAYALVASGRRDRTARVFAALKGRVTSWPWQLMGEPVGVFSREQSRSQRQ